MNSTYSQSGNTIVRGLWGKNNKGIQPLDTQAVHFAVDGANTPVNKLHYSFFKVNQHEVKADDVLSNNLYRYRRDKDCAELLTEN